MKAIKMITLLTSLLSVLMGYAYNTAVVNGITWKYEVSNGEAKIYGKAIQEYNAGSYHTVGYESAIPTSTSGAVTVPNTLGGYPVTTISGYAFANCVNITQITVPDSVTKIWESAFMNCSGLKSMTLPFVGYGIGDNGTDGDGGRYRNMFIYIFGESYKFTDMPPNLTSVTITKETYIGYDGFSWCSKIKKLILPDSVKDISSQAFRSNAPQIEELEIGGVENVTDVDGYWGLLKPFGAIKKIKLSTFLFSNLSDYMSTTQREKLEQVTLGKNVVNIPPYAFAEYKMVNGNVYNWKCFPCCTNLKTVVMLGSVTNIGHDAFYGCTKLSAITIPKSVMSIENNAFKGCNGLSSVTIGNGVQNIGADAFRGCTKIKSIFVPASVKAINSGAFADCSGLDSVSLPISIYGKVNQNVFSGCESDLNVVYRLIDDGTYIYYEPEQDSSTPPMSRNSNILITPTTRSFVVGGGYGAINTSGSGTWTAAVSDPWITLNATSGNAGYPVAYTVSANTNAEQRVGYVYVSGYTHTVTQDGCGATISPEDATFETAGGTASISVSVQNKVAWKARSHVDWIGISKSTVSGVGSGSVNYYVTPYDEVATRQGTLTVAGNTFTVFQYGRRMKLDSYSTTQNYETHVIPITVNALAVTQWSVTPKASWISVVDGGNGQGGDLVTIAIAENPSYKVRTGTVTIGTETFTVRQQGRPTAALSFNVSPANSTASVEGANGTIAVTATPDLPWTATSGVNWLTIYAATATGAGNGNVVYVASPNPTLSKRTGTITITPEAASGVAAKTHTVTQPAATASLSSNGYEFAAAGGSCSVNVSCANIVEWSISESLDWITVNGSTSRTGPGTVTLQAAANNTVYSRSGTVKIAGKTFNVSQKARGVEVEYDNILFGTDGGGSSISIHPDGNSSWKAVASDATWITIFQGDSGTGDGEIQYIVSPYVGNGTARTGWITVGDKKVYITQRAYDLNIEPNGTNVVGNAGAGEFGVSAGIGDVWTAIVTEPWITIVNGYDSGTGNGTVRFLYTENMTGKTRSGKIIVAGEVYTIEQRARQMVAITATAEHGGHVSGGGSYDLGTQVTLTAVPDSGYAFSYWTGAVSSMQNPLVVTADVAKSYTAVFEPLPIVFTSVVSDTNGVTLAWNNLAWAGTYRIYRGLTSVPSSATVLVELPNNGNCTYLDETGDVGVEYWYWIEAEGPSDEVMSDPMTGRKEKPIVISPITYENLRGATNPNPATYREGTLVSFQNPGAVTGYTFAGWAPSQITTDMAGAQAVRAAWTANSYSIAYNPNGGSGTMDATAATYDSAATVAANGFTWSGHVFAGWATNVTGEVVYAAGQPVTNLTAQSGGVVTLYAVWEDLVVATPTMTPSDGTVFTEGSCMVALSCATEGAVIYYSPKGSTPRLTEAFRYTGPFAIMDTTTIKAVAVLEGVRSEYMTATIAKRSLSLADAAGAVGLTFTTGGDATWSPVSDATATSGFSAQSGEIGDDAETWMQTVVSGCGTLTFKWKVDCEWDDSGDATWDHVAVSTDGVEASRMDGTTAWEEVSLSFSDAGPHTIRWTFSKDDYNDEEFPDRAWVSGVTWTPSGVASDSIPDVEVGADTATVNATIDDIGFADLGVKQAIGGSAERYSAFKAWAQSVKGAIGSAGAGVAAGEEAVVANTNAAAAFMLGAERLFEKAPVIEIGEVAIGGKGTQGMEATETKGTMTVSVTVKDGEEAVRCAAEKVKEMFEATGDLGDWNGGAKMTPTVAVEDGDGATMRFKVTPGDGTEPKAFLRVKVK